MLYMIGSMLLVLFFITMVMVSALDIPATPGPRLNKGQLGVAYLAGARFDIVISQITKGKLSRPDPSEAAELRKRYDHGEL